MTNLIHSIYFLTMIMLNIFNFYNLKIPKFIIQKKFYLLIIDT